MRVLMVLLALVIGLAWIGYEVRAKDRPLSNVLFVFSTLFATLAVGAFFDWF